MKKEVFVLPLLLLTACAGLTGYEDDAEYYDDEDNLTQTELPVQRQTVRSKPVQSVQQQPVQQVRISPDGTVIELPAQQIYLGDTPVPPGGPQPQYGAPLVAYSSPTELQSFPVPPPTPPRPAVVTLQNIAYPNTFAQCASGDVVCITSYEQQGYRRLNGNPQFAGYREGLAHSDYPQEGQWRNNNNIPRW